MHFRGIPPLPFRSSLAPRAPRPLGAAPALWRSSQGPMMWHAPPLPWARAAADTRAHNATDHGRERQPRRADARPGGRAHAPGRSADARQGGDARTGGLASAPERGGRVEQGGDGGSHNARPSGHRTRARPYGRTASVPARLAAAAAGAAHAANAGAHHVAAEEASCPNRCERTADAKEATHRRARERPVLRLPRREPT